MARNRFLGAGNGERLLAAKLRMLSGIGERRTSTALSILTGAATELPLRERDDAHNARSPRRPKVRYARRTVYLSERHLKDIEQIIEAWQAGQPKRLNRSVVLRRAIEHLRTIVESDPALEAPSLMETSHHA